MYRVFILHIVYISKQCGLEYQILDNNAVFNPQVTPH